MINELIKARELLQAAREDCDELLEPVPVAHRTRAKIDRALELIETAISRGRSLRLLHDVTSDPPFEGLTAPAGIYVPANIRVNRYGAVSVLGVKPDEMVWL